MSHIKTFIFFLYLLSFPVTWIIIAIIIILLILWHSHNKKIAKQKKIQQAKELKRQQRKLLRQQKLEEKRKKRKYDEQQEKIRSFNNELNRQILSCMNDAVDWEIIYPIQSLRFEEIYDKTYLIKVWFSNDNYDYIVVTTVAATSEFFIYQDFNTLSSYYRCVFMNYLRNLHWDDIVDLYHTCSEKNLNYAYFTILFKDYRYIKHFLHELIEYHNYQAANNLFDQHKHFDWWQIPSYGESYSDKRGIHFSRVCKTDFYNCTHFNIVPIYDMHASIDELGKYAEYYIPRKIFANTKSDKFWYRMIWNAYIPSDDGTDPEIDCLIICSLGIVCIECKHKKLPISFNKIDDKMWYDAVGDSFASPYKQNLGHVYALTKFLQLFNYPRIPIYNVVAFYNKEYGFASPDNLAIIKRFEEQNSLSLFGTDVELKEKFAELIKTSQNILSKKEINTMHNFLFSKTQRSKEQIEDILKKKKLKYSKNNEITES